MTDITVPTSVKVQLDRGELNEEDKKSVCSLKIRMEANVTGKRVLKMQLIKTDTIQTVFSLIDKYSDFQEDC